MRKALLTFALFATATCAAFGQSASQAVDDQKHGFSLSYPKEWRSWAEEDEKCHLTLRSSDDHLMVFVLSEVLDADRLPKADGDLVDWARFLFVHSDPGGPKVAAESIEIDSSLFRKCVAVRLAMTAPDGKIVRSEIFAFTDFPNDHAHLRIWKVFAMFEPGHLTHAELDGWQKIKTSLRITRF